MNADVQSGPALAESPFQSVPEMVAARARVDPAKTAVRQRGPSGKWVDLSWADLDARRAALAAGLQALGVDRGEVIAIVAPNSTEMLLAELAAQTLGAAVAPIFPGYAAAVLQHCLADSGARIAFAGSGANQHQLAAARQLDRIVVLDDRPLPGDSRAMPLSELAGAARVDDAHARRDDLAYLLYTSGTTGKPKGVELTHWNALSQQTALAQIWDVTERDVFLSYLPWHHCFGALFERLMALWNRALLVIDDSRGRDLDRLFANLFEMRPTVYFGVPRVYNGMIARAATDAKARKAIEALRFAFSAAAPISEPAFRFFEELGVPVLEGWGLTETSPCATITRRGDPKRAPGVVGSPLPGTSVKLDPIPDLAGRGEIQVRGPQVMRGYHNRPADTRRILHDGWISTGDLGEWTPNGLKLSGRVDGVFKLANGEKVSAGEVEARVLAATPLLEQAVVVGSAQPFVTSLCWISQSAAQRFLQGLGLDAPESVSDLAESQEVRRAIVEALQAANLLSTAHYEHVRKIALVPEAPSLENGELTPTMKMVRGVCTRRHEALITAMLQETAHPAVLEIFRRGDAFGNA